MWWKGKKRRKKGATKGSTHTHTHTHTYTHTHTHTHWDNLSTEPRLKSQGETRLPGRSMTVVP